MTNKADNQAIKDLEKELQQTKTYYNKRLRETEDKYKYGNLKNANVKRESPAQS